MGVGMGVEAMSVHPNGREIVFSEFQRRRFQVWAMERISCPVNRVGQSSRPAPSDLTKVAILTTKTQPDQPQDAYADRIGDGLDPESSAMSRAVGQVGAG